MIVSDIFSSAKIPKADSARSQEVDTRVTATDSSISSEMLMRESQRDVPESFLVPRIGGSI